MQPILNFSRGPLVKSALLSQIIVMIAFVIIYFFLGRFSLNLALINPSASPVWPNSGLAVSAILLFGSFLWPSLFLSAFLVNFTTSHALIPSLGIALGNTLEAVVGAYLVNRFASGPSLFNRPNNVIKFTLFCGGIGSAISATTGVTTLCLGGLAQWKEYWSIWLTWFLGNAGGTIVFTPMFVLWALGSEITWKRWKIVEALGLLILAYITGISIFGNFLFSDSRHYPLSFFYLPIVMWGAFRFGQRETATLAAILSALAAIGTSQGIGPFAVLPANESLLILQAFMIILTTTSIACAAAVSEQKKSEDEVRTSESRLKAQAIELARSNADLEQFAYAASHDLQEPLRMVTNFSQMLSQRYEGKLDATGDEYIGYVVGGAKRMQNLLKDLLEYSRATTTAATINKEINCNVVLEAALLNLKTAITEAHAEITHDKLPFLKIHELDMLRLFQNLISNGIKYHSDKAPKIHIGIVEQDREWIFTVSDNGIGIKSEYFQKIFGIFKRLHGDKYPGTGIGLAVCQKIVERYGGRIWVESVVGKGSKFHFTLPK